MINVYNFLICSKFSSRSILIQNHINFRADDFVRKLGTSFRTFETFFCEWAKISTGENFVDAVSKLASLSLHFV